MKKLFFTIALLFSLCGIHAKNTIHWITFFDTTDLRLDEKGRQEGIGEMDANTRKLLYGHWINQVNAALAPVGYKSAVKDFYGTNTNPENCESTVRNLVCDTTDIIVFYYVGHGARSRYDTSQYPQMCLAQHDQSKFKSLERVHNQLKSKNARLTITIGMCCNSVSEGVSPKKTTDFSPNRGVAFSQTKSVANIQKLFLENKGDIIVASCDSNQVSRGGYIDDYVGIMDIFSYNLIVNFVYDMETSSNPTWENLLGNIQDDVDEDSMEKWGESQTPIYDYNLKKAEWPKINIVNKDKFTKSLDDLTECLDYIIYPDFTTREREELAADFKSLFAKNAKVQILAQGRDLVVDEEPIEDFLDRVSFTKRLLKVIAVDRDLDQNQKIQTLWVREHYLVK